MINKEKEKRIEINEEIEMKEWEEYFRRMLEGLKSKSEEKEEEEEGEEKEKERGEKDEDEKVGRGED